MFELAFLACLAKYPDVCHDFKLTFQSDQPVTQVQCFVEGQYRLSQWFEEHPGYELKEWHCQRPTKDT